MQFDIGAYMWRQNAALLGQDFDALPFKYQFNDHSHDSTNTITIGPTIINSKRQIIGEKNHNTLLKIYRRLVNCYLTTKRNCKNVTLIN